MAHAPVYSTVTWPGWARRPPLRLRPAGWSRTRRLGASRSPRRRFPERAGTPCSTPTGWGGCWRGCGPIRSRCPTGSRCVGSAGGLPAIGCQESVQDSA